MHVHAYTYTHVQTQRVCVIQYSEELLELHRNDGTWVLEEAQR